MQYSKSNQRLHYSASMVMRSLCVVVFAIAIFGWQSKSWTHAADDVVTLTSGDQLVEPDPGEYITRNALEINRYRPESIIVRFRRDVPNDESTLLNTTTSSYTDLATSGWTSTRTATTTSTTTVLHQPNSTDAAAPNTTHNVTAAPSITLTTNGSFDYGNTTVVPDTTKIEVTSPGIYGLSSAASTAASSVELHNNTIYSSTSTTVTTGENVTSAADIVWTTTPGAEDTFSSLPVTIATSVSQPTSTVRAVTSQDALNRKYYSLRYLQNSDAMAYWVNEATILNGKPDEVLQDQYLSAEVVPLSFPFNFYGHEVDQVTIATGGFLYMSDFLYEQLTFSQYIAPLMANFDLALSNKSNIHYYDNGTAFVVWWENVLLGDQEPGPFSFQVILYNTSEIVFVYKQIPVPVSQMSTKYHAVKVGVSDAYYFDQISTNGVITQRTISEYSRINVDTSWIGNQTAVLVKPLPTCIVQKSCSACLNASIYIPFVCQWCRQLSRCSDGLDRLRQQWLNYGCRQQRVTSLASCSLANSTLTNAVSGNAGGDAVGAVGLILVVSAVVLLVALVSWFVYATQNPSSPSGQWLIEHRPQVLFRRVRHSALCCYKKRAVSSYVSFRSDIDSSSVN